MRNKYIILAVEESANSLGFYDSISGTEIGRVLLSLWPHEIAVSPDNKTAYVTNFGVRDYDLSIGHAGNSISIIDIETQCEKGRLYTKTKDANYWAPHGVKVSPDGKFLFVNVERVEGSRNPSLAVSHGQEATKLLVYDLKDNSLVNKFEITKQLTKESLERINKRHTYFDPYAFAYDAVSGTHNFVFSPDGNYLWLFSGVTGVQRMNPKTGEITASITNFSGAVRSLSFTSDGQLLVSATNEVSLVNPETLTISKKFGNLGVGQILYSKATPDVKHIVAPAVWQGKILIISVDSGKVVRSISTGIDPVQIFISPDGETAICTHGRSKWITEIELTNFTVTKRIRTLGGPNGAAYVPFIEKPKAGIIIIGACLPFTNNFSVEGRDLRLGYQYWEDKVNASGGFFIKGKPYKIEIRYIDTESIEEESRIEKTVSGFIESEGIKFVLGSFGKVANEAIAKVCKQKRILHLSSTAYYSELYEKEYDTTFGLNSIWKGDLNQVISSLFSCLSPKPKTASILTTLEAENISEAKMTANFCKKRNLVLVSNDGEDEIVISDQSEKGIKSLVNSLNELTPDLVFIVANQKVSSDIIRISAAKDFTPGAFAFNQSFNTPNFSSNVGDLATGMIGCVQWSKSILNYASDRFVSAEDYARSYFEEYSEHPSALSAGASATGVILQEILVGADSFDIAELKKYLFETSFDTFYGTVKFNAKGINIAKPVIVSQFQRNDNQQLEVLIWPKIFAGKNNVAWPFNK